MSCLCKLDVVPQAMSALVLAVGLLIAAAPTAAQSTRFEFELTNTQAFVPGTSNPAGPLFDGGGFFVVNEPIPAVGTVVLVAAELQGSAARSLAGRQFATAPPVPPEGLPFGYSFGNTFDFLAGPPEGGGVDVTPHNDAQITFVDGVATGIDYRESHACNTGPQCLPSSPAGNIQFSGTRYSFDRGVQASTGGFVTITPAVPEPATAVLLGAGLLLLSWRHRRPRITSAKGRVVKW